MKKFSIGMFAILTVSVLAALGYIPTVEDSAQVTVSAADLKADKGDMVIIGDDKIFYVTHRNGDALLAVDLAGGYTATLYPRAFPQGTLIVKESDERNQQVYALRAVKHKYAFVRR
jgi:hypothetical protein